MYIKNSVVEATVNHYKNEPINISFSFLSSWSACQMSAFLDYVVKIYWIERDGRNFIVGTVFHNLFEQWYKNGDFDTKWLYANYKKFFKAEVDKTSLIKWRGGKVKDEAFMLDKLKTFITNQLEVVKKFDLIGGDFLVEERFEVKEKNFNIKFKGFIDLLYQNKNGDLWILDYKTQSHKKLIIEQLLLYYFGYKFIWKKYKNRFKQYPDKVGIILPYCKDILFRNISQPMVDKYVLATVLPTIKEVRKNLSQGKISCNKSACVSYGQFCKYRPYCPAWNNNFENLMELHQEKTQKINAMNNFRG